jgi:hypothetical protein
MAMQCPSIIIAMVLLLELSLTRFAGALATDEAYTTIPCGRPRAKNDRTMAGWMLRAGNPSSRSSRTSSASRWLRLIPPGIPWYTSTTRRFRRPSLAAETDDDERKDVDEAPVPSGAPGENVAAVASSTYVRAS